MKSPQTKIVNEKTPTVGLGCNVKNTLVRGFEKARAISNPLINRVAYSSIEKNSQIESKTHSTPELATFCTKINIAVGGEK